jgi:hypothetical protein
VTVLANKLIPGANRPRQSTKGGSKKQSFELNQQRVCTDSEFVPARQIGPVEVVTKSGEGDGQRFGSSSSAAGFLCLQTGTKPICT